MLPPSFSLILRLAAAVGRPYPTDSEYYFLLRSLPLRQAAVPGLGRRVEHLSADYRPDSFARGQGGNGATVQG